MLKSAHVIDLVANTLNYVEPKLTNHGNRVAYIVFRMLKCQQKHGAHYSDRQIRDICFLALLHDIGAYKTEDIDKMISFETDNVWAHSIYGYLFLKYFSPLKEWAPAVLYHHADCDMLKELSDDLRDITQIVFVADRVDVLSQLGVKDEKWFANYFSKKKDVKFRSSIIDLLFESGISLPFSGDEMSDDAEFNSLFYGMGFTEEEIDAYFKMMVISIDFRSAHTVNHTIVAEHIATLLSRLLHMTEEETREIHVGAMLHDLGKVGIPVSILEKPGKLDPDEFAVMKSHVDLTEEILRGHLDPSIEQIALRHHEKLDGSGYPKGLSAKDLNMKERLLAVADIFSALCGVRSYKDAYPKEKIISILTDMSDKGYIDSSIVGTAVSNIDHLLSEAHKISLPVLEIYKQISNEYTELYNRLRCVSISG